MDRQQPIRFWILSSLLLVFGALFLLRGPGRALDKGGDLSHLYAASGLWLTGGNPYDGDQCVDRMRQAGHDAPEIVVNGSFYPQRTFDKTRASAPVRDKVASALK